MNTVLALSGVVIKELYRRKDFYVLFVLTAVITLLMGSVSFFHDAKIVRFSRSAGICRAVVVIAMTSEEIQISNRQISFRYRTTLTSLKKLTKASIRVSSAVKMKRT